jgi:hypothetical protein
MPQNEIKDFDLTDRAIDKASWHRISEQQIFAVLDHFWTIGRNRVGRAGSHIVYGTDNQGRCLAIPVVATDEPHIWRPITAWYYKPHEAAILRKARGR